MEKTIPTPAVVVPDLPALPVPRRTDTRLVYDAVTYARPLGYRPLLMDLHLPADVPTAAGTTATTTDTATDNSTDTGTDGTPDRSPTVPCVVWIHGGAWWEGDRRFPPGNWPKEDYWFRLLTDAGMAVASIDYRLSGEAHYPAQLADCQAAIRYLRHHAQALGIDPDRIGVSGESAGGHLAAMVALTGDTPVPATDRSIVGPASRVRAAVPFYPVTDLLEFLEGDDASWDGPTPEELLLGRPLAESPQAAAAASPVRHARAGAPPMLLLHGAADTLVRPTHSERLASALRDVGAPVRLELVPGGEHCFDGVDPTPSLRAAAAFLAEHLRA